jgi:importin subunit beta-1
VALQDEEQVGAQGLEFWTSLAEVEIKKLKKGGQIVGYINQCNTQLVSLLLQCTQKLNKDGDTDDTEDWGVALSAGCCLDKVAQLLKNEIMNPVITFVASNIQSTEWKNRYSALLALGAITEGPDKMQYMTVIMPGIPNLIGMFGDAHVKVRETIGWVFSRICEHHADVISNDNVMAPILTQFIKSLPDQPKVSN